MSSETLEWTPEAEADLARHRAPPRYRDLSTAEVRGVLDASLERFVPCYERGAALKPSPEGAAALAAIQAWVGATPAAVSERDAAYALSLLGSRSDDHGDSLAELLIRERGIGFVVRALVEMWSMATNYRDPDWPNGEGRLAIWLTAQSTDTGSANDASVSHGKSDTANYLSRYARAGTAAQRAELRAAVTAAWDAAPLTARAALAVAAYDFDLAERAAREFEAASPSWQPHYAERVLPDLIRNPKLLAGIASEYYAPEIAYLANHELAALPLLVERFRGKLLKAQRADLIAVLINVRGPTIAALLAPYAELAPFTPHIRAYFTRYPELLAAVRADKKLAAHREQLTKLAVKTGLEAPTKKQTPEKPAAKKPAAKKPAAEKGAAKKPAAKKPTAKKPAAKKSAAKKSATKKR